MPRKTLKDLEARVDELAAAVAELRTGRVPSAQPDPSAHRDAVRRAMRALGAVSPDTARTAGEIAAEAGLSRFDAYLQLRHDGPLVGAELVRRVPARGADERYWLTRRAPAEDGG
jgi:hypothetical protein